MLIIRSEQPETVSSCIFTSSFPPPAPPHLVRKIYRRRWVGPDGCPSWCRPPCPPPSPAPYDTGTAPGRTGPHAPAGAKHWFHTRSFQRLRFQGTNNERKPLKWRYILPTSSLSVFPFCCSCWLHSLTLINLNMVVLLLLAEERCSSLFWVSGLFYTTHEVKKIRLSLTRHKTPLCFYMRWK